MISYLLRKAEAVIKSREPDFLIGPPDDPYLKRWYVVRTPLGGLYIHEYFHDDDDRALHDHPWFSLSILLRGALGELYYKKRTDNRLTTEYGYRIIQRGDIRCRSPWFAHRLQVEEHRALTLFFFGPVQRRWGFWCPQGWRYWKDFVDPTNTGLPGRGCGEE